MKKSLLLLTIIASFSSYSLAVPYNVQNRQTAGVQISTGSGAKAKAAVKKSYSKSVVNGKNYVSINGRPSASAVTKTGKDGSVTINFYNDNNPTTSPSSKAVVDSDSVNTNTKADAKVDAKIPDTSTKTVVKDDSSSSSKVTADTPTSRRRPPPSAQSKFITPGGAGYPAYTGFGSDPAYVDYDNIPSYYGYNDPSVYGYDDSPNYVGGGGDAGYYGNGDKGYYLNGDDGPYIRGGGVYRSHGDYEENSNNNP